MAKRRLKNFITTDQVDAAIAYLREHGKGDFDMSETCRAAIIRKAKSAGWKPDA